MNDFVVVANRLPVDRRPTADGGVTWVPSPGGLVTALSPVLRKHRGCWVGWPGSTDEVVEPFRTDNGVLLHPVTLTADDYEVFYEGFSNAALWPLYHDLIVSPQFLPAWWESYREVNHTFAAQVAAVAAPNATVWVQDYQLQLVPGILRQIRPDLTIGFFLHIPFPGPDLYRQMPWREEVLRGMLGADLIGFHLAAGADNFLQAAKEISGLEVTGRASVRDITAHIETPDGRTVAVGAFPISIDTSPYQDVVVDKARIRKEMGDPQVIMLGVDRLDYTKGILQRLKALEELYEVGAITPEDKVMFVQIATPSRERIDHYQVTRSQVEEAVGRINGKWAKVGSPLVSYHHTNLSRTQLIDLFSTADIMLVTPYKDGMNLVAKEYVVCHPDGSGALVLSEFAGAAQELSQAYLCNPFDIESLKKQIQHAMTALRTDPETARARMLAMHEVVMTHDVNLWATSFLDCLGRVHA